MAPLNLENCFFSKKQEILFKRKKDAGGGQKVQGKRINTAKKLKGPNL